MELNRSASRNLPSVLSARGAVCVTEKPVYGPTRRRAAAQSLKGERPRGAWPRDLLELVYLLPSASGRTNEGRSIMLRPYAPYLFRVIGTVLVESYVKPLLMTSQGCPWLFGTV